MYNHITILTCIEKHILKYFFFLIHHFQIQSKVFVDLCTVDLLVFRRRFYNVYNTSSITTATRLFSKFLILKTLKIQSVNCIFRNSN